ESAMRMSVLDPVSGVFIQKRQRLERPHPIEKQDAIEVIRFVLNHPGREGLRMTLDPLTCPIEGPNFDLARPRDAAADVWNAETSFPSLLHFVSDRRDLRIDDASRPPFRIPRFVRVHNRHEQTQPFVNLRSRKTDTVVLDHRLDHVVDQPLNGSMFDFWAFEGARLGAKHGMSHARDLQNGHEGELYRRLKGAAGEGMVSSMSSAAHDPA